MHLSPANLFKIYEYSPHGNFPVLGTVLRHSTWNFGSREQPSHSCWLLSFNKSLLSFEFQPNSNHLFWYLVFLTKYKPISVLGHWSQRLFCSLLPWKLSHQHIDCLTITKTQVCKLPMIHLDWAWWYYNSMRLHIERVGINDSVLQKYISKVI